MKGEVVETSLTAYEPKFHSLVARASKLRRIWSQGSWTEGPSWIRESKAVVFSDVPNDRQLIHSIETGCTKIFRGGRSHFVNGTAPYRSGLLLCEHGTRSLSWLSASGERQVLANQYRGGRLNSPNDVTVAPNGDIWFTDPSYGIEVPGQGVPGPKEQKGNYVFRLSLNGDLSAVLTDFAYPNGIAITADGSTLYVADSGGNRSPGNERHIRSFAIDDTGKVCGGEVLARCPAGVFDGFRLDAEGRIWASASDGVYVISPEGVFIGHIAVPECVANLCFGGGGRDQLFITAKTSLYALGPRKPLG